MSVSEWVPPRRMHTKADVCMASFFFRHQQQEKKRQKTRPTHINTHTQGLSTYTHISPSPYESGQEGSTVDLSVLLSRSLSKEWKAVRQHTSTHAHTSKQHRERYDSSCTNSHPSVPLFHSLLVSRLDSTVRGGVQPEDMVDLPPRHAPTPIAERFKQSSYGLDQRGRPLVDNKSGLGLCLGLHSDARASLEHFQKTKHAELLRYDPSIGKFVQGYGASTQRAAPIYNSTRQHRSTRGEAASREMEFGGGSILTHRIGSSSDTTSRRSRYLFPRHKDDSQPLQRLKSLHSNQSPFATASTLTQMAYTPRDTRTESVDT